MKLLALCLVAGAAFAVTSRPARATNECNGLQVCVRIAGPWVVVPTRPRLPRPRTEYLLSCPRRYIVGGLDAEVSDRRVDVGFLGKVGSPVNPGITTERDAVFEATYAGSAAAASFRPHLGCIPASGGGGGPVPSVGPNTLSFAAAPRAVATIRRARLARLRAGAAQAISRSCGRGERLVGGWHAVGFYTAGAPSARLVASVVARRNISADRVTVSVRSGQAVRGVRAVVQVGAVCGGGA